MTLMFFPDTPKSVDSATVTLWLQGQDTETKRYVDCRLTAKALMDHCGARGQTDDELLRAFNEHRAEIENACRRKYAAGQVEHAPDRIIVRLAGADL